MAYKDLHDPRYKESRRRWYLKNKEKHLANKISRRKRNRDFVLNYKKGRVCMDCNKIYSPWVMEFDHKNKDKKYNISGTYNVSIETLKKEIAKCDLVCANCHREREYKRALSSIGKDGRFSICQE